jgi:hypothetical protein
MEAERETGVNNVDIMRTYNRTKFDSRGGYKWKLQKRIDDQNPNNKSI